MAGCPCGCDPWSPQEPAGAAWVPSVPVGLAWAPGAAPADAWHGFDPGTGLYGPGTYIVTDSCFVLATENGAFIVA